jgi:outer membrane receptor protein involved in Fe transport
VGSQWSDGALRAGIETLGAANGFFEVGMRRSNGYYDSGGRVPAIAAGIDQFSIATGIRSDFEKTSVHAAVAAYQIAYSGGPLESEYASPSDAAGSSLVSPSLDAQFRLNEHWSVDAMAASTFRLPTLLERYAHPPASGLLEIDRNALMQTTVAYSDLARIRAAITAYRQNTNGYDTGAVAGIGGSLSWQLAPRFALRTWVLRETDTTHPVVPLVRFTPSSIAATVGSAWLTYELPAFRIDAIYRSDLLDTIAVPHLDYAVSGSAGGRARWFVSSEVRHGARFTGFGLRFL